MHWPLLVFAKYFIIRQLNTKETLYVLILSLITGFYFWLFFEKKLYSKLKIDSVLKYSFLSISSFVIVYAVVLNFDFFSKRFTKKVNSISESINSNYKCNRLNIRFDKNTRICKINYSEKNSSPDILLIGNSHAQMYGYVFEDLLKGNKKNGYIISQNACLPTLNYNISINCLISAKQNIKKIAQGVF